MTRDPFRRPPMVDIPIAQGESIFWRFSNAMDRMVEAVETYEPAEPWFLGRLREKLDEAGICPRCGCHPDRHCGCTPDTCGCTPPTPPNPETPMFAPARRYTPVNDTDDDEVKRVKQAQNAALFLERVARTDPDRRYAAWQRSIADDITAAYEHRQQAARTQPPEPPVGTVLETSDQYDDYRIERTDDGWHIQYRDGEDEHGRRLHPGFGGRGISWAAAWSAHGPPNGAAPFREVPADSPLLPAHPVEPGDDDPIGPDASDGRFEDGGGLPPAAQPYDPPARTERQVCGPEKTTPPTGGTTNGSAGGTGMSITDARGGIMGAHQSAEQALNELMAARSSLEDSQNGLRQGTEGSNQAEAEQAHAQLAEALSMIDEAQQQVASALQEFEGVANRL